MKKLILVLAVLFTVSFAQAQTTGNIKVKTETTTSQVKTTRPDHQRKHPKKHKKITKKNTKAAARRQKRQARRKKHAKKNAHEANQE